MDSSHSHFHYYLIYHQHLSKLHINFYHFLLPSNSKNNPLPSYASICTFFPRLHPCVWGKLLYRNRYEWISKPLFWSHSSQLFTSHSHSSPHKLCFPLIVKRIKGFKFNPSMFFQQKAWFWLMEYTLFSFSQTFLPFHSSSTLLPRPSSTGMRHWYLKIRYN